MKILKYPCNCLLCENSQEFVSSQSLVNHIWGFHKVKAADYADMFLKEKTDVCKYCGNSPEFVSMTKGYKDRCKECGKKHKYSAERTEKIKNTRLKNSNGAWFTNETKETMKTHCLEKFGTAYYFQSAEFKEKQKESRTPEKLSCMMEKLEETIQKLYHVKNISQLSSIKEKKKNTYFKTSGYCYPMQNPKVLANFKRRCYEEKLEKYKSYLHDDKLKQIEKDFVSVVCHECHREYTISLQLLRKRFNAGETICTNCNSICKNTSKFETELFEFIKNNFNIVPEQNNRTVLNGKELDIYIPEKKLAIEFDGLYWHNELYRQNDYHLRKTEECEKRGIQLIHIFEDEWKYKTEIVKSRLSGIFGFNKRIFARKCECKAISYDESRRFLDENHIQGNCVSKYRYGLFYDDELVAVMTFGKSRFKDEFEMLRFCNKLYTNVIGGAGKLFKHFLNDHPEIAEIVSFADRRWSQGDLYEKLNFSKVLTTPPNYYYIVDDERRSRIEFQKHKLVAEGYDKNKTEHEIMLEREIYRIYDCGNLKYEFVRKCT